MSEKKIYTAEQMMAQRDAILDEFNFHNVLKFTEFFTEQCKADLGLYFKQYLNVSSIRSEAKKTLNDFIQSYVKNEGELYSVSTGYWKVYLSTEHDHETPLLTLRYSVSIEEMDAYLVVNEMSKTGVE